MKKGKNMSYYFSSNFIYKVVVTLFIKLSANLHPVLHRRQNFPIIPSELLRKRS